MTATSLFAVFSQKRLCIPGPCRTDRAEQRGSLSARGDDHGLRQADRIQAQDADPAAGDQAAKPDPDQADHLDRIEQIGIHASGGQRDSGDATAQPQRIAPDVGGGVGQRLEARRRRDQRFCHLVDAIIV